jgi:hypothetical protein
MNLTEITLSFDLDELKKLDRVEAIQQIQSWIDLAVSQVILEVDHEK